VIGPWKFKGHGLQEAGAILPYTVSAGQWSLRRNWATDKYSTLPSGPVNAITVCVPVALRDAARPTYWDADENITDCSVCGQPFGPPLKLHHCRACGKGVCGPCSPQPRPVPSRGWDHPVRVCTTCYHKPDIWWMAICRAAQLPIKFKISPVSEVVVIAFPARWKFAVRIYSSYLLLWGFFAFCVNLKYFQNKTK